MRTAVLIVMAALCGACGPSADEDAPERATLAVMAEIRPGMPLDEMLAALDTHLVSAMRGRMEGSALEDFRRAEAITDRLLEARVPFEWIPAEDYSVESRLRQIQSAADRVLAHVQTSASRDVMLRELRSLRTDVARLRQVLAQGGTRAPPHIEALLSSDTAGRDVQPAAQTGADPASPAAPRGPQPLGTPVRADTVPRP